MGGEWASCRIGAFAKAKGGKRLPKGSALQDWRNDHPYIRVVDFGNGTINADNLQYVPDEVYPAIQRYTVDFNDVLISIVGTIGAIAQVPIELHGASLTENAAKIILNSDSVGRSYLAYYLKSSTGQSEIAANTVGSTQPKLPLYGIEKIEVPLPPLSEQHTIADILGTLDDKIELNRQMNRTLEAMARAIFKAWFVDFEPVKAKAAGATTFRGMPQDVFDQLPARLTESELGPVPEGWDVKRLNELMVINPKRILKKGDIAPYLPMSEMPTRGHGPENWEARALGSGVRFTNGDTLVARITPCLENGKTAFVDFLPEGITGWGSTEYIVIRPKEHLPDIYAYCLARSSAFRDFAIKNMTGTSGRQRVPASAIGGFKIVEPCVQLAHEFGNVVGPLFAMASGNLRQSRTLASIRDTLLPKLISGEIRVPDSHGSDDDKKKTHAYGY